MNKKTIEEELRQLPEVPLKLDTPIAADHVVEVLKQLEEEHATKLKVWDTERLSATAAKRRTPRVTELAGRLGISRVGLNAFLKQLQAEHRVEVYKRVGEHDHVASVKDDARDRALAVDARRREIIVLRTLAEDWVKAHGNDPVFDVQVRMECDEKGAPVPGRVLLEVITSCNDKNMISLLEAVKSTCDKCGSTVPDNGPCLACNDAPFGV